MKPVSNQIFVVDRDRLTCSGGSSTAQLAAFLIERHLGKAHAAKSLRIMMIDQAVDGETPQPTTALDVTVRDPIVKKALLIMQQNLEMPLSTDRIAGLLGANKRRIERHFRTSLRTSPKAAYGRIRLNHARHLLLTSDRSIASIAVECGYCDSSHLSENFRRYCGKAPQQFREEFQSAQEKSADQA